MIQNAQFVSVWDDCIEFISACNVNTDTKEVFNIDMVDTVNIDLGTCTAEYIIMNGIQYPVSCDGDTEYWYE